MARLSLLALTHRHDKGNASIKLGVKRITPRHIMLAFRGDQELDTLAMREIFPDSGVIARINPSLVKKSGKKTTKEPKDGTSELFRFIFSTRPVIS